MFLIFFFEVRIEQSFSFTDRILRGLLLTPESSNSFFLFLFFFFLSRCDEVLKYFSLSKENLCHDQGLSRLVIIYSELMGRIKSVTLITSLVLFVI
jgi:hypothetical protein